jgi:hypothetical protein
MSMRALCGRSLAKTSRLSTGSRYPHRHGRVVQVKPTRFFGENQKRIRVGMVYLGLTELFTHLVYRVHACPDVNPQSPDFLFLVCHFQCCFILHFRPDFRSTQMAPILGQGFSYRLQNDAGNFSDSDPALV